MLRARLTLTGKFMLTTIDDLQMERTGHLGKENAFEVDPNKDFNSFKYNDVLYLDSTLSVDLTAGTLPCFLLGAARYNESLQRVYNVAPSVAGVLVLELTGNLRDGIEEFRRIGYLMVSFDKWAKVETERTIDIV
ncbi:hypothetical protein BGZ60DRAFT_422857 [Tricladium varicosporioides]|nr:hypothetical protein BGZ60DRAFT_422857 [Hymenoscyphus varicosporioides]